MTGNTAGQFFQQVPGHLQSLCVGILVSIYFELTQEMGQELPQELQTQLFDTYLFLSH